MKKNQIKAIAFDLDNVLVMSSDFHKLGLNKALKHFGYEITQDEHDSLYNGLPTKTKLNILNHEKKLPKHLFPTITALKNKYTSKLLKKHIKPDREKIDMLNHISEKYRLCCCSNATRESVINMLSLAGMSMYFEFVVGNDEGFDPKPSPDIYLAAFKKLGLKPNEVCIVEDSPHGIEAARASRACVIPVRGYDDVNKLLFKQNNLL